MHIWYRRFEDKRCCAFFAVGSQINGKPRLITCLCTTLQGKIRGDSTTHTIFHPCHTQSLLQTGRVGRIIIVKIACHFLILATFMEIPGNDGTVHSLLLVEVHETFVLQIICHTNTRANMASPHNQPQAVGISS